MSTRAAVWPLAIYAVTTIYCWLTRSRLGFDEAEAVLNIVPTRALALATAALAVVHWAFAFRGRVALAVAALWAAATTSMATMFLVYRAPRPQEPGWRC